MARQEPASSRVVVVKDEDVAREGWEDDVRGSLGFRPLIGTTDATDELTAGVAELRPGDWLGRHRHRPAEVYYVLTGSGTLEAEEETHLLAPGTAVWIPGDLEHGVRNTGDATLRLFYAFAVDSDDDIGYDFLGADGPAPPGS